MTHQSNSTTANQLLTKEDLQEFQKLILKQVKEMLPNFSENERWLKTSEVCKMLKVSHNTLLAMRLNNTIAFTRIGRNLYYKKSDIENFMLTNYNKLTKK